MNKVISFFKFTVKALRITIGNEIGGYKQRSEVPKHEIEAFVHTFYPAILAFFESDEGKREYEEWRSKRETEAKKKKATA